VHVSDIEKVQIKGRTVEGGVGAIGGSIRQLLAKLASNFVLLLLLGHLSATD